MFRTFWLISSSQNALFYFYELFAWAQCFFTKISIGKNIALLNWPAFNRCVNESLGSVNYPLLIRQLSLFQTFWFISSSYSFYFYELCAWAQCFSTKIFIGKCIALLNWPAFNKCVNESLRNGNNPLIIRQLILFRTFWLISSSQNALFYLLGHNVFPPKSSFVNASYC